MKKPSFRDAFLKTPGPRTPGEAAVLAAKGVCMGTADIIPGVSGGTIALIAGIYKDLLAAIKSVDAKAIRRLVSLDLAGAMERVHLRFLIVLLSGIGTAILLLSRLMNYLLKYHPEPTFSLFFGLILASVYILGKRVTWRIPEALSILLGSWAGYYLVGLIPVSTPNQLWFIFLSGVAGICAMILPGISGAFILLVLGKYEFITGTLKAPFSANEATGVNNLLIIIVFCSGCAAGLAFMSRFLNWLLAKWYFPTLAFLTGLMGGSLRKIWPWKGEPVIEISGGKEHIVSQGNILPQSFDSVFVLCILLMVLGAVAIVVLDRLSEKRA